MANDNEYIIGAGDRLSVFVWGEAELSVPALVRPDGRISLPGAGEIMAEGLTPEALQKEIAAPQNRNTPRTTMTKCSM